MSEGMTLKGTVYLPIYSLTVSGSFSKNCSARSIEFMSLLNHRSCWSLPRESFCGR